MNSLALQWRALRLAAPTGSALWATVFGVALLLALAAALRLGSVEAPISEWARALVQPDHALRATLLDVRLPRIACAAAVGAALAVSGTLLQTALRNPLADPGIVGVTAGAGLAALIGILFFPERPAWLPGLAFAGGLGAVSIVLALGRAGGRSAGPLRLVLSGVGLQAICFAGTALLTFLFADRAPSFVAFMVGSLNGLGWHEAMLVAVPTAIGLVLAAALSRPLDVLLLDDATAGGLGVSVRRARFGTAALGAWLAAGAVSVAGLVAFIGLVVPNGVRLLVGPEHRDLLPIAALAGATLAIVADTAARTLAAPIELPVGALLAMIGGPYFLFVLWRKLP